MSEKLKQFKPKRTKAKSFGESKRNAKNSKFYDAEWTRYRYRFIHYNPYCYACGNKATDVDHLIAHKGSRDLFWKRGNHVALCKSCHSYVTAKFDCHNPPKTEEKMDWLLDQRKLFNVTNRIKVINR